MTCDPEHQGAVWKSLGGQRDVEKSLKTIRRDEAEAEIVVMRPQGKLTLREGHDLLGALFDEIGPRPRDVVIDMSGVSDMSSWGFALVCGLARKLAEMGRSLRIARPGAFVRKYLELFGESGVPMPPAASCEDTVGGASGPHVSTSVSRSVSRSDKGPGSSPRGAGDRARTRRWDRPGA